MERSGLRETISTVGKSLPARSNKVGSVSGKSIMVPRMNASQTGWGSAQIAQIAKMDRCAACYHQLAFGRRPQTAGLGPGAPDTHKDIRRREPRQDPS